jgi:hypothetical protein
MRKRKNTEARKEASRANLVLRSKSPADWLEDIMRLPEDMMAPVAKIVWWDWLSSGPGNRKAAIGFDRFLNFSSFDCPENRLINGLLAVGYTELQATTRLRRNR